MKLLIHLYLLCGVAFCCFSQDKYVLYDEDKNALTLYFKDGRTFHVAAKPYEGYPFQWWDFGPEREGYFNLRNVRYNKCVYYDERSKTIEVTTCQEADVQKWKMEKGVLINKRSQLGVRINDSGTMSDEPERSTNLTLLKLEEVNESPVKVAAEMENMGENINSIYPEVIPVISGDGNRLFFMRKELTADKKITSNIYSAVKISPTRWSEATKMAAPLNNEGRNYVCSASATGETLLLGNEYNKDGSVSQGISISHFKNGKWTFPKAVEIEGFDNKSAKAEYSLSHDNRVLTMAVETEASIGQRDIFVSFLKQDGTFSKPLNLGPTINTPFQEDAPFLSADRKTLYFSSNGLPGYGRHDIFMSKRVDTSWTNWSKPVNLGRPINSADWEAYFMMDSQLEYAYVVAENDKAIGRSDIFRIKLPKGFSQDELFSLRVNLVDDKTGLPVDGIIEFYNKESGEYDQEVSGSEYLGYFGTSKAYAILVRAENYVPEVKNIVYEGDKDMNVEIRLKMVKSTPLVRLKNLQFDTDKMVVNDVGYRELNMIAELFTSNPELKAEIAGHTDNSGTKEYNQKLSEGRAKAVYDYLIGKGVSKTQLVFVGYGEREPLDTNDSEKGKAINRRVEVRLLKE